VRRILPPFLLAAALSALLLGPASRAQGPAPEGLSPAERLTMQRERDGVARRLAAVQNDRTSDADLFLKAVRWALTYDAQLSLRDGAALRRALSRARERIASLESGAVPWAAKKGRVLRAYTSRIDGSTQPYGLVIPAGYDPARPTRLDVVLHGSSKPVGMSELYLVGGFDDGDAGGSAPSDRDYIELHPLGRVENGYRWAGETDLFEAIDDACRCYNIDRDRIVLRGMSMGASGAWHVGLKNPDRFVALGPYCGYVDTHEFSRTPGMSFVEVGVLPPHQEAGLHMLDSVDYAANAGVVPCVAAIGEKDPFFQAHVLMGAAFRREGLEMVNLISPGTGHTIDPVTMAEQMRRIKAFADRGLDHNPPHLRFVTWTLKYSRCHWLQVLGLKQHYQRAEIEADRRPDGSIELREPMNVTRFALFPPALPERAPKVRVAGAEVALPTSGADGVVLGLEKGRWRYLGRPDRVHLNGKTPGLQGPIDDAFTAPFLCVRGTGAPWHPAVQQWARKNLDRFACEWHRYFRGDLPVKDDTEVTPEDLRTKHLVLFGDPGSNLWIRKALPGLPVRWTRKQLRLGTDRYPAADHAPSLICASPLPGAGDHYLVLNTGHTFHEKELASLNYLLYPRLGDWAVMRVGPRITGPQGQPHWIYENALRAGYFNEHWRLRFHSVGF
jgi:hypothetical protein